MKARKFVSILLVFAMLFTTVGTMGTVSFAEEVAEEVVAHNVTIDLTARNEAFSSAVFTFDNVKTYADGLDEEAKEAFLERQKDTTRE